MSSKLPLAVLLPLGALTLLAVCAPSAITREPEKNRDISRANPQPPNPGVAKNHTPRQGTARNYHRLPPNYSAVVSEQQRAAIYAIQDCLGPRIEQIQLELNRLRAEQRLQIEGVLRPEQRAAMAAMRGTAASRGG
jgi:hypothetical protein